VLAALARWVQSEAARHPELVRLGCFGSYARGDWGPGSDLDLVAVVRECDTPFERRAVCWATEQLPVPVQLLVYTQAEWQDLSASGGRFGRVLEAEILWVYASRDA
jgi:hypothetical protein